MKRLVVICYIIIYEWFARISQTFTTWNLIWYKGIWYTIVHYTRLNRLLSLNYSMAHLRTHVALQVTYPPLQCFQLCVDVCLLLFEFVDLKIEPRGLRILVLEMTLEFILGFLKVQYNRLLGICWLHLEDLEEGVFLGPENLDLLDLEDYLLHISHDHCFQVF